MTIHRIDDASLSAGKFVGSRPCLILFHATWCPYCKEFYPTYRKVARTLASLSGRTFFGTKTVHVNMADIDVARKMTKAFGVTSYPTLFLVTASGRKIKFNKTRTHDNIIQFVNDNV